MRGRRGQKAPRYEPWLCQTGPTSPLRPRPTSLRTPPPFPAKTLSAARADARYELAEASRDRTRYDRDQAHPKLQRATLAAEAGAAHPLRQRLRARAAHPPPRLKDGSRRPDRLRALPRRASRAEVPRLRQATSGAAPPTAHALAATVPTVSEERGPKLLRR
jgi:hypothetical protein